MRGGGIQDSTGRPMRPEDLFNMLKWEAVVCVWYASAINLHLCPPHAPVAHVFDMPIAPPSSDLMSRPGHAIPLCWSRRPAILSKSRPSPPHFDPACVRASCMLAGASRLAVSAAPGRQTLQIRLAL